MRNLLITMATLMVLSACQKDNLSNNNNEASESIDILNNTDIELETRNIEHSIYGRVWEDEDGDGLQDFNEPPIQNITISLRDVVTNQTIDEYVTDETGEYFFDIEVEGVFYLEIKLSAITHNYIATEPDVVPIEVIDSDVDHTFGINTSPSFEEDYNDKMDFGFYESGVLGNQVWIDNNITNGGITNIFDGSDLPLSGVVLNLYSINLMTGTELLIDSTITNSTGNYSFQNLRAGTYIVEVRIDNSGLNNFNHFVLPNVGSDDSRDSDIVEIMSSFGQSLIGRTGFIDLAPSEINLDTDIGISDQSAIICFIPPGAFGTLGAGGGGSSGSASPNGTVWIDTNGDGFMKGGEPTMEGVTVDLINSENDSIIQTVITDDNGYYEFDRINNRIANCYLQISQPRGYMLSKNVSGSCYPTSDFDQKTRKTATFRTSACPYYSSYDAGLVEGIFILGRKE